MARLEASVMKKPENRMVYVCECVDYPLCGHKAHRIDQVDWLASDVGKECRYCHQPVTAINIDRLLRIEEAARDLITNNLNAINMGEIIGAANLYGALHANPGGSDDGE